jgi:hypothetical protein
MKRHARPPSPSEYAESYLDELGLALDEHPENESVPHVPEDITDLSDRDLMVLFTELVSWQNYAASRLAVVRNEEEEVEAQVRYEASIATLEGMPTEYKSNTPLATIAKALRDTDDEVVKLEERLRGIQAKRRLLGTVVENLERNAALVSRELTRRVNIDPRDRRDSRWGGG